MEKINFYLINASIVPDIYKKVIKAKSLLASGEAKSASQAAKMADISRSAYYIYKDAFFDYLGDDSNVSATINAKLMDNAGVLTSLMAELYKAAAYVISVNQSVPIHSVAEVSVTVRIAEMAISKKELLNSIEKIDGVNSVVLS